MSTRYSTSLLGLCLDEYACHEGNYSLANILTAARYPEGRAEQSRR